MTATKKKPLQVYLLKQERDFVESMALELGIPRSDYIRTLINAAAKKKK